MLEFGNSPVFIINFPVCLLRNRIALGGQFLEYDHYDTLGSFLFRNRLH